MKIANGIGSPLAEAPSHTTGHAGPHPAVRLIKAAQEPSSDNPSDFKQAFSECNDNSFDTTCRRFHVDSLWMISKVEPVLSGVWR